jgi:hypothetical protein
MRKDQSEHVTTLRKEGTAICLPMGRSLSRTLERFGFAPGQEVVLRFHRERVEIVPRRSVGELRRRLSGEAGGLKDLRERIRTCIAGLPEVSDRDLEEQTTAEAELLGLLECLVADDLDPAVAKLDSLLSADE